MKIHILSDIHLEFADMPIPEVDADITIIAGDLHLGSEGLRWAMNLKRPVFYVPGNHEFYHHDMNALRDEFRKVKNINILDNQIGYGGGCLLFGATLWTDFDYHKQPILDALHAKKHMNDYKLIRYQKSTLTPDDTVALHKEALRNVRIFQDIKYPVKVIVTHHLPSRLSVHPNYAIDALTSAFASHLEDYVEESGAKLWIHGHTHSSCDYKIGQTRVICNPRGYPPFNNHQFNPNLVVEV